MRQIRKRLLKQTLALLLILCMVMGTVPVSFAMDIDDELPAMSEEIAEESAEAVEYSTLEKSDLEDQAEASNGFGSVDETAGSAMEPPEETVEIPTADSDEQAEDGFTTQEAKSDEPGAVIISDDETTNSEPVDEQPPFDEENSDDVPSRAASAPTEYHNENSEYAIVLGPGGVTSGYAALDDTEHTLGNYTVPKTYILRFQDESFTITNSTGGAIRGSEGKMTDIFGAVCSNGSFSKGGTRNPSYLSSTLGVRFTDVGRLTAVGYNELDPDSSAFYFVYFIGNTTIDLNYALLIEITPNGAISETGRARLALGGQIDRVTGYNADNWYQSGDRYNGKTISKNGFWNDMQAVLADAQSVYVNTAATAAELTAAAESLADAINALIPAERTNATSLYEAVQSYRLYDESRYTEDTWAPFAAALSDAQSLLTSLFNDDGSCTDYNVASNQQVLDTAVQEMDNAASGLLDNSTLNSFNYFALLYRRSAEWLLSHTDLVEEEYTTESWAAWVQARNAMAACAADGCGTTEKIRAYLQALSNANTAYYALESRAESVTVHVRVADTFSLLYPQLGLTDSSTVTFDDDVTLAEDKTVSGLMNAIAFNKTQKQMSSEISAGYFVFINGVLSVDRSNTYVDLWMGRTSGNEHLHEGDQVVISVVDLPAYYYYIHRIPNSPYYSYYSYLSLLNIEDADRMIEAEAGQSFEITVSKTAAATEVERQTSSAVGTDLFLSPVQTDEANARSAPATQKMGIQTDENGKASVTVYTEGWYRLAVADVTEQTAGSMSVDDEYVSGGEYSCLASGDYVLLHIMPSSDSSAVRAVLQAELDGVYGVHKKDFYTDVEWRELTSIYEEATAAISDSELLGDAYSAQKTACIQMRALISSVVREHEQQLKDIAFLIDGLPDDLSKFTAYYAERFLRLDTIMNELSDYMKGQVTLGQQKKYEGLRSYYHDVKHGQLDDGHTYTVTFDIEDETGRFYSRSYVHYNIVFNDPISDRTYYLWNNDLQEMEIIPGSTVSLPFYDHLVTDASTTPETQIIGIAVDGVRDWTDNSVPAYGRHWVNGEAHFYKKAISFTMPDNNVTVHVTVGTTSDPGGNDPGDEPVDLDTVRQEALQELADLFETYDSDKYASAVWNRIVSAKTSGDRAIRSAATENSVAAALQSAMSEMLSIGQDSVNAVSEGIVLPEYGDPVGRVYISMENTTYPEGNTPFEEHYAFADNNLFFAGWYDLCENDTMMTALLKAMTLNGLSWLGTGGTEYGITYLSTVYVDVNLNGSPDENEPRLAEFNGGPESGWMGTLNDWFVNYGFDQFGYSNGRLFNGDVISVKYTSTGLGKDLGGGWGDPDTSIKALNVDGGEITPAFDSATRVYTLIVPGGSGSIRVTPTAKNKNYLVKTFLNTYNSDDAFYSRTQRIPVKAGDVVYVGCGEHSWPSMNNQEGETISYTGTKYTFYIVGSEADSIDKKAELLPAVKELVYSNYRNYSEQILTLYEGYSALSEQDKQGMTYGSKLESLAEKVRAFIHVDEVKTQIAALPKHSEWTDADKPSLQAVLDGYSTLSEAERLAYMTVSEGNIIDAIEEYLTSVATVLYGDANGDGKVNSRDATRILRFVAGYQVEIDLEAADANGDGKVNSRDATRVLRYVAGYNVTLGKQG